MGKKIILNICTHGDEKIGLAVVKAVENLRIKNGELIVNIANKKALKLNRRFVDQDLNRTFPGKRNGNHEERLAYKLLPLIKSADIVIDIHSTTSELKDALIVTKIDKATKEYIRIIDPKYVLNMKVLSKGNLISAAKVGLAFEYGKDKDKKVLNKIIVGIKNLLIYEKMIESPKTKTENKITFFSIYKQVEKPTGAKLKKEIKNYKLIRKNQTYANIRHKKIIAKEDFYPILFGNNNYENIFGFAAKKSA